MKTTNELYGIFWEHAEVDEDGGPVHPHKALLEVVRAVQTEPHSYPHKVGSVVEVDHETLLRLEESHGFQTSVGNTKGTLWKGEDAEGNYHVEFVRSNGKGITIPIPRRDIITKAPKSFPGEEVLTFRMTRAHAEQRGLLICKHCGYPRNNHFQHDHYPCAHDKSCPGYEEKLRSERRD